MKELLVELGKFFWNISLLTKIYSIVIFIFGGSLVYFWRYLKAQIKFWKNLKRKVYFLKTSANKDLQNEKDLISNIELFNIENEVKDIGNNINKLDNLLINAVYIVWYDEEYSKYSELIGYARNKRIPVIIFANQWEIKKSENWNLFNGYIYCDIANTPNRLSVIILNIMKIV